MRVNLNPVVGREMQGDARHALVLSTREFNRLGAALVAPITQGGNFARVAGFTVSLAACGTETQGVVVLSAARMLDLESRQARKVETAPRYVVEDALQRFAALKRRIQFE